MGSSPGRAGGSARSRARVAGRRSGRPVTPEHRELDPLRLVTSIGSPIALATSLLFYFGWARSQAQATQFGADASVFGLSTTDYVLRSIDILFFPVLLLLLLWLGALWLDRRLVGIARSRLPFMERATKLLRFCWAGLLPLAVAVAVAAPGVFPTTLPFLVSLSVLGTAYGVVWRRRLAADRSAYPLPVLVLVGALMTVTLFWQTERLAAVGGRALARDIQANMGSRLRGVTLYSTKRLNLTGNHVAERIAPGTDMAYEYRGLFLLQASGGKYFLVTDGWRQGHGKLIALADNDSIRLEFGSGSTTGP